MKKYTLLLVIPLSICISCQEPASDNSGTTSTPMDTESVYDSLKVAEYGADQYGMKKYVMAFLKRGPNRDRSPEEAQELQRAHLENIARMAEEGKLVVAGPFLDPSDELRGIYIFNVPTIEEAEALTQTDPAIRAGGLAMELKEWYGSAALVEVNEIHETLAKKNVSEE